MNDETPFRIPLTLSISLEPQRAALEEMIASAYGRIVIFAEKYGWGGFVPECLAESADIYDSKYDFDRAVIHLLGLPPATTMPEKAVACLENGVLMAVSPTIYSQIYPEGIEANSYEKLIAHEIAHRLHVRILGGDEDAMGPIWFFEGFAIHAASQFENSQLALTDEAIWEVVRGRERIGYERYAAAMRHFLARIPLPEMIKNAGTEGFEAFLKKACR